MNFEHFKHITKESAELETVIGITYAHHFFLVIKNINQNDSIWSLSTDALDLYKVIVPKRYLNCLFVFTLVHLLVLIKYFLMRKKHYWFLMFRLAHHAFCIDKAVIFCLCRHEFASLNRIRLVLKVLLHKSFNRMSLNL